LLCPEENVQLKITRKIKRTMLISNFVHRSSERPEICSDDFAIVPEMINIEETNKADGKRKPRKRSNSTSLENGNGNDGTLKKTKKYD
jgi:hypothetical protein